MQTRSQIKRAKRVHAFFQLDDVLRIVANYADAPGLYALHSLNDSGRVLLPPTQAHYTMVLQSIFLRFPGCRLAQDQVAWICDSYYHNCAFGYPMVCLSPFQILEQSLTPRKLETGVHVQIDFPELNRTLHRLQREWKQQEQERHRQRVLRKWERLKSKLVQRGLSTEDVGLAMNSEWLKDVVHIHSIDKPDAVVATCLKIWPRDETTWFQDIFPPDAHPHHPYLLAVLAAHKPLLPTLRLTEVTALHAEPEDTLFVILSLHVSSRDLFHAALGSSCDPRFWNRYRTEMWNALNNHYQEFVSNLYRLARCYHAWKSIVIERPLPPSVMVKQEHRAYRLDMQTSGDMYRSVDRRYQLSLGWESIPERFVWTLYLHPQMRLERPALHAHDFLGAHEWENRFQRGVYCTCVVGAIPEG
jgi:hypothetical protein